MKVEPTPLNGVFELLPKVFSDDRGWFMEVYKAPALAKIGITAPLVQQNLSFSTKGVIRGLHMQLPPMQQAKLVTVLKGKVFDVVVDLRAKSSTFGKWHAVVLDSTTHNMLFVPEGFAHGFRALEDALLLYLCSEVYHPEHETGILWNDPELSIAWGIDCPTVSEKDSHLPTLAQLKTKGIVPLGSE